MAFLAHVDTAPDCSGKDIKPILHRKYNGSVIRFPDNPFVWLIVCETKGKTLEQMKDTTELEP